MTHNALTMSARESAEVRAALAAIDAGMSRREAAALHGVDESSIYRARARRGLSRLPRAAPPPAPVREPSAERALANAALTERRRVAAAARRAARQAAGPTMP